MTREELKQAYELIAKLNDTAEARDYLEVLIEKGDTFKMRIDASLNGDAIPTLFLDVDKTAMCFLRDGLDAELSLIKSDLAHLGVTVE